MPRNFELKARLTDLAAARCTAARLSSGPPEVVEQVDTYFACPHGRLKLREIAGQTAQLVAYTRPDQPAARASDYRLVPIENAAGLKAALSAALGVRAVVRKRRELSLVENVRIHLDQVEGLGTFLEFEALLGSPEDERRAPDQLARLAREFGLAAGDLIPSSYGDLLFRRPESGEHLTAAQATVPDAGRS